MYYLQPLINGKAHEHADISVVIMNRLFTDFTSIDYTDDQDIKNGHAAGSKVNYRTYGTENPTAKISFLMKAAEALQAAVPTGRLQDIPEFDVVVTYVDAAYITVVHKIRNCRFKNNGRKSSTGDGAIIVECELVISHINWK